ncbi:MAG: hypothetical protein H6579_04390 [Chitinophagales bacterium]|nr:hypothetical protein [Chitinophagales bacterium]
MKKILFICLISFLIGCANQTEDIINNERIEDSQPQEAEEILSVDSFLKFGYSFQPNSTSFSNSLGEDFNKFNLDSIFLDTSRNNDINLTVNIILFKQHHFLLQNTNQGYNLFSTADSQSKKLLDKYIELNNLFEYSKWLNSGLAYYHEKEERNFQNNIYLDSLTNLIDAEAFRIEKLID